MKYLILGGAGFIGQHLSKKLLSLGHEITIIDSLVTSRKPEFDVEFIQADIRNYDVEDHIKNTDIIYFLAGSLGVEHIDKNPTETFQNNIGLMNKLIPLFERYRKKVIFSSTSEVYGEGPFSENDSLTIGNPQKLRWAYSAAKLITEFSITTSSFPYVILRFFNVVGPGQLHEYGMVLPRFIKAAKNNDNLIVYGTGKQTRTFCHIDDAIDCMLKLEKFNNEIFNIGSENLISIDDLAKMVVKISGSKSKITYLPYEKHFSKNHDDIQNRCPDLKKVKTSINYTPGKTIEDIIRDCL